MRFFKNLCIWTIIKLVNWIFIIFIQIELIKENYRYLERFKNSTGKERV